MPPSDRFTVSLDTELLAAFDHLLAKQGYENRSEAIRDLIRDLLLGPRLAEGHEPIAAVVTVVCQHDVATAHAQLRALLLESGDRVLGFLTHPLDTHRDLMAIMLSGTTNDIQRLADKIKATRGLSYCTVTAVPGTDSAALGTLPLDKVTAEPA